MTIDVGVTFSVESNNGVVYEMNVDNAPTEFVIRTMIGEITLHPENVTDLEDFLKYISEHKYNV